MSPHPLQPKPFHYNHTSMKPTNKDLQASQQYPQNIHNPLGAKICTAGLFSLRCVWPLGTTKAMASEQPKGPINYEVKKKLKERENVGSEKS